MYAPFNDSDTGNSDRIVSLENSDLFRLNKDLLSDVTEPTKRQSNQAKGTRNFKANQNLNADITMETESNNRSKAFCY